MESFHAASFRMIESPILEMYAFGLITGTVLSLGEGSTCLLSIHSGHALPGAVRLNFGGRELTHHVARVLKSLLSVHCAL